MCQSTGVDDDDEDELELFMKGIERQDIEEEDDHESYFNYVKNAPVEAYPDEDDVEIDYDSDGNPIVPEKSKIIVPLPRVDHSEVSGAMPTRPCISFAHFGFDEQLMTAIRKSEYTQPTPIQCQSIPVALTGRDIIGIAKTGSGKTAAYLWPAIVHIMDQPELQVDDGPIALICAPTRELCQQIYTEARRFGKVYNIHTVAVFGGGNKYEQSKSLQEGAEIVVATPGRLIDHVKSKATNLRRVTFLVFDEADRMFDMGFEPQVRSIANNVRPDRQTLLFSATFKKKVEFLCRDTLIDPIRVVIGELGELAFCCISDGSVLIFVTKKVNSEELAANMKMNDFEARGLDIPSIKTVINYDVARDITTHTHRIGRTGRAGMKGVAHTLLTATDQHFAGDLVRNLEIANQVVPEPLLKLAMKNSWFKKSRFKHGSGKRMDRGGKPRVRERPGLGLPDQSDQGQSSNSSPSLASASFQSSGGVWGNSSVGNRTSTVKTAF
ncbi:hypothetical protein QZH41_008859, partial [Actinostola sp. cb2023]